MPLIPFHKYQGAGNDFIMIDDRTGMYDSLLTQPVIQRLCDRRFGIGADGLILLQKQNDLWFMKYYNSDGRQSTFCGNGGRCFIAFADQLGIVKGTFEFVGTDGPHAGSFGDKGQVELSMMDVNEIHEIDPSTFTLYTGSPHYVSFRENIDIDVFNEGRAIRNSPPFQREGINVNFVKSTGPDAIEIRTYERGVEDETYACGTGVVASAIANAIYHNDHSGKCDVKAKGGNLKVNFDRTGHNSFKNVLLTGPAEKVFEGHINI